MAAAEGLADFRTSNPTSHSNKKPVVVGCALPNAGSKKKKKKPMPFKKEATKVVAAEVRTTQVKPGECFIYRGPHRARVCPKREKVNALTSLSEDEPSSAEGGLSWVNPIQLLNMLSVRKPPACRELLYITVHLNGQKVSHARYWCNQ